MRSYAITALVSLGIGIVAGVGAYKRLNPPKACPQAEEAKTATEMREIIKYVDKEGKPVVKERVVTNVVERKSAPAKPESRPNLVGVQVMPAGGGNWKVGPTYSREAFPNVYVGGGVLINVQGRPEPAVIGSINIRF